MGKTVAINIKTGNPYDVYIGRPKGFDNGQHYGNPFSSLPKSKAAVTLPSRGESIRAFAQWLNGTAYQEVEPERRKWILENLHTLKGKRLGCFCKPLFCHGDILAKLAEGESLNAVQEANS